MCKYCKGNELIVKHQRFEISIKNKKLFIEFDPSFLNEDIYIEVNFCSICGENLRRKTND